MYSLLNKVKNLCLSLDIQFELRDALVKPMLLFGSDLWGLQNMESVFPIFEKNPGSKKINYIINDIW
jgi:hypothetical protein